MNPFVIVTDSTCDLPDRIAQEYNLVVMPLKFHLGETAYVNYLDNRELDPKEFYDLLRGGAKPTTSQINPDEYVETLTPILKEGKDVLILSFSSALSGTFNSARIAKEMLLETFPERKIMLIDTKAASLGEGLLVYQTAKEVKSKNLSLEQAYEFALNLAPQIAHWFTVDDIEHLVRGGRITKTAGIVAKLVNIKPIMHVSDEGKLVARQKAIGRKRAIKALVDEMEKSAKPGKQVVFIGHGDDLESAEMLRDLIRAKFDVEELVIHMIGPVIGSHAGQGVLALFFIGQNR